MRTPTPSQIKALVESRDPPSPFFARKTMRHFGDTMRNFGSYTDENGQIILYRKRPVKSGVQGRFIFDPASNTLRVTP